MNRSKNLSFLLIALFLATSCFYLYAHEGEKHPKKDSVEQKNDASHATDVKSPTNTVQIQSAEFPNLHPLVVHFPIVLLIVAAIMQMAGVFLVNRPYHITTTLLLLSGFISGYLANSVFHAHTWDLPAEALRIFEEHERWANYSVWLSGLAVVIKIISLFFRQQKWIESFTAIILVAAAISVAITGHHGAELVHKHGIGPKGNYLKSHH